MQEKIRLHLLLRCSGITRHVHLYTGHTGPQQWVEAERSSLSLWVGMNWIFPGSFVFFKARPCCSVAYIRHGSRTVHGHSGCVLSMPPRGNLWISLSRSAGFSRQPVMLREQRWRLGFGRGSSFTSGRSHIDLRFIRSMLSAPVWRGSARECQ